MYGGMWCGEGVAGYMCMCIVLLLFTFELFYTLPVL